ncbi:hypothetical protein NQ318_005083 [Aromia moschata]|uniref:DUF5641 domain-containing protein n=1 Tax=Aromia moschata TaxID=1265417 RepID=A0AAV8YF00_9CUCU|nr:hypothetical protein NQ318_005083 [Aromia moschata]
MPLHHGSSLLEIPLSEEAFQEERKPCLHSVASTDFFETLLNNYSSLNHLQRVIAYVLRFVFNLKNPANKHSLSLSFCDLNQALLLLIKYTQQKYFSVLLNQVKCNQTIPKSFQKLSIFLDDQDILRVGGRLHHSNLTYDKKHPALLPRSSRLTTLLIEYYHRKYLHAGAPPLRWQLARVVGVHPGADGVVRVATVRTSTGLMKRPVVKLCPLPLIKT